MHERRGSQKSGGGGGWSHIKGHPCQVLLGLHLTRSEQRRWQREPVCWGLEDRRSVCLREEVPKVASSFQSGNWFLPQSGSQRMALRSKRGGAGPRVVLPDPEIQMCAHALNAKTILAEVISTKQMPGLP